MNNTLDWLGPHAPSVTVTYPNGGETLEGEVALAWSATDLDDEDLTFSVYYSNNGGTNWTLITSGLTNQTLLWDTTTVSDGDEYMIRVVVSDGLLTGEDSSDENFTIKNEEGTDWALYGAIAAAAFFALLAIIIYIKKK
jgi:hypothetical protein